MTHPSRQPVDLNLKLSKQKLTPTDKNTIAQNKTTQSTLHLVISIDSTIVKNKDAIVEVEMSESTRFARNR